MSMWTGTNMIMMYMLYVFCVMDYVDQNRNFITDPQSKMYFLPLFSACVCLSVLMCAGLHIALVHISLLSPQWITIDLN